MSSVSGSERYEALATIGQGAFGVAVLSRRREDGLALVIKKVNVRNMSSKEKSDALQEVSILSKLQHKNIIAYHEAFFDEGCLHIVLDYADSGTLEDKVKEAQLGGTKIPIDLAMTWFEQLASGIDFVHSNKIVHRDIKTANIFLTGASSTVKIGDFGIAKVLATTADMANTMVGTPYYLSPELCENRPYNSKSDIWALGCVLYELCALKKPFCGGNMAALILNILRCNYEELPDACLDRDHVARKIVQATLQLDAAVRPSAKQLLGVLESPPVSRTLPQNVIVDEVAQANSKAPSVGVRSSARAVSGSIYDSPQRSAAELRAMMKQNLQNKKVREGDDPEISRSMNIRNRMAKNQGMVQLEARTKGLGILDMQQKNNKGAKAASNSPFHISVPREFMDGSGNVSSSFKPGDIGNLENVPTYNARLSLGLCNPQPTQKKEHSVALSEEHAGEDELPTVKVRFSSGVGRAHSPRFSLQGDSLR